MKNRVLVSVFMVLGIFTMKANAGEMKNIFTAIEDYIENYYETKFYQIKECRLLDTFSLVNPYNQRKEGLGMEVACEFVWRKSGQQFINLEQCLFQVDRDLKFNYEARIINCR